MVPGLYGLGTAVDGVHGDGYSGGVWWSAGRGWVGTPLVPERQPNLIFSAPGYGFGQNTLRGRDAGRHREKRKEQGNTGAVPSNARRDR